MEPACPSSSRVAVRYCSLFRNSTQKNGKGDTVADAINWPVRVSLSPGERTRDKSRHFMNKFRKLGLISYNGKIEVYNSLLNAVLREKPEIERDDSTSKV